MIGARLAHEAAHENASTNPRATTTSVADDLDHASIARKPIGTVTIPAAVAIDEESDRPADRAEDRHRRRRRRPSRS